MFWASPFRWAASLRLAGWLAKQEWRVYDPKADEMKYTISIDNPCLFITAVAKDRLPVFRSDAIKTVTCAAINEARTSCGFLLFAYVLMPDHIHVLTDSP